MPLQKETLLKEMVGFDKMPMDLETENRFNSAIEYYIRPKDKKLRTWNALKKCSVAELQKLHKKLKRIARI